MAKGTIKWEPGELITSGGTPLSTKVYEQNVWEVVKRGKIIARELTPHHATYLDIGKEYTLNFHEDSTHCDGGIWEIPPEQMKRESSQMLLYDWEDGPGIELDF